MKNESSIEAGGDNTLTGANELGGGMGLENKTMNITDDFEKQLEMGVKVEMEHTKDVSIATKIALDHLKEDPKYYTKLTQAGLEEDYTKLSNAMAEAKEVLIQRFNDIQEGRVQREEIDAIVRRLEEMSIDEEPESEEYNNMDEEHKYMFLMKEVQNILNND